MKLIKLILLYTVIFASNIYCQTKRPQEPKEPYEYNSEDVSFLNKTDSIKLCGTFTFPKKGSNFPAVILISGSGPQDRNSELLNHKPFLVIADYLTKNGVAVLRVDDRGAGNSEGNYNKSGIDNFAKDTESALHYLKTRKEINPSKIGLIGHSLGGVIAPMIASKSNDISFLVLLAGSGIRGADLMLLQKEKIERLMGVPEDAILMGQYNIGGAYGIVLKSSPDSLKIKLKEYFLSIFGMALPEAQINVLAEQISYPWFADFIKYNPQDALKKVKCPVLALNGSNDMQVPAKENLAAIENALKEGENKSIKILELPKLNHLFQECETGSPEEYASIEQTFSPEVLEIIQKWILKITN